MRFEIPEKKKLVMEIPMTIRWGDMDVMGHVNNAAYFRYLEAVRIDWMNAIGCPPNPRGEGPVIVNAFCSFFKQLVYPGELAIKLYVSDPGRTTFESWILIERQDQPGVLCAAGGGTTIWVDSLSQKAKTLPDWLRQIVS